MKIFLDTEFTDFIDTGGITYSEQQLTKLWASVKFIYSYSLLYLDEPLIEIFDQLIFFSSIKNKL